MVTTSETPRHTCLACGGSCHGVVVRLLSEEERARVEALAPGLGVEEPVVGGALRRVDGRCVFLEDGTARCRIHAAHGPLAKPHICRQYPAVRIETAQGPRYGVDPGCYTAWRSARSGEPLGQEDLAPTPGDIDPAQEGVEGALLALCATADVRGILERLARPGVEERWLRRLQASPIERLLMREDTGAAVRDALLPVVAAARSLTHAPQEPLPPALDRWAVEVLRRTLHLRIHRRMPVLQGAALITLLGAVAAGWSTADPDAFGRANAAWSRAIRAPAFWSALLPDPGVLRELALGP